VTFDEEIAHLEQLLASYRQSATLRRGPAPSRMQDVTQSEIASLERETSQIRAPILARPGAGIAD